MDIGKPIREVTIEPIEEPIEITIPDPVTVPEKDKEKTPA